MNKIYEGTLTNPIPQVFLSKIIEPVLCNLKGVPFSSTASQLLLGTAIKESGNFKYRKQIRGPALSYFQIEPETHDDIWENYLKYRPNLASTVKTFLSNPNADKLFELENNDNYTVVIARISYKRAPEPLPMLDDLSSMAKYWKKYYNTPLGKGTIKGFLELWNRSTNNTSLIYKGNCQ